jgi:lactate permease
VHYEDFTPISGSLGLTAMFAALPILTLFVLLGGLKMRAQWAALIALSVAIAVAISVYGMPADQTGLAALEGAAFGLFPIMWIVITAIWVFNMTVESGHFAVLRRSVETVSKDQRIQAVMIGFCFGALLEALAGFGAPVAITSMMMVALGFRPIKAASLALVANTAPVPFGAIATPITTLSEVTGLEKGDLGAMVGRQTPVLAIFLPLTLIAMVDGRRGIRQTWPVAVVAGFAFAIGQFACSNYGSVELTDIVASLLSMAAIIALVRVWEPKKPRLTVSNDSDRRVADPLTEGVPVHKPAIASQDDPNKDPPLEVLRAYAPYLIIIGVFSIAQIPLIKQRLSESPWTATFQWPGLHVRTPDGEPVRTLTFNFNWFGSAGTLMLIAGLVTMVVIGLSPVRAMRVAGKTFKQLGWTALTVVSVLALAYVVNQSGQTITLGLWAAGAGSFFAFLSPLIGWLGVAVTGSDTASNALFGGVQVAAAHDTGISPVLLAAGNSSGGVFGKMSSAQHLAIGAAAVRLAGQEGVLFRKVVVRSLVMMFCMCALVYLQSTPALDWTVVK